MSTKLVKNCSLKVAVRKKSFPLQLEVHLQEHTYLYVKDITSYVELTFGVKYTVHGMRNWLHRHGFSYKKPAIVPGKANAEQQREWIAKYEKLRQELSDNS